MARQMLNADHAIDLALEQGADWLLHLDIDELFCCAESVASHFSGISQDVAQVSYLNHEAAPEGADMEDYFREVTLFKVNPALCPQESLAQWRQSSGRRWFFLGYDNGKAAVRLRPGVTTKGVHLFEPPPDPAGRYRWVIPAFCTTRTVASTGIDRSTSSGGALPTRCSTGCRA